MELIKRDARSFGWRAQQLLCLCTGSRLYVCYVVGIVYGQCCFGLHLLQVQRVVCLCFIVCFRECNFLAVAAIGRHGLLAIAAFHLMVVFLVYRYIGQLATAVVERQTDIECAERITNQYQYAEYLFQNSDAKNNDFFKSQLSHFLTVIVVGTITNAITSMNLF